jgi:hypothetical protein
MRVVDCNEAIKLEGKADCERPDEAAFCKDKRCRFLSLYIIDVLLGIYTGGSLNKSSFLPSS